MEEPAADLPAPDRYNRVTYFDFPIPPDFHLRQRRSPVDSLPPRRRGSAPASYRCRTCGIEFVAKSRAGRIKRVNGKVYPRRFCSRVCYAESLRQYKGGTPA